MDTIEKLARDFLLEHNVSRLPLKIEDVSALCKSLGYDLFSYEEGRPIIQMAGLERYLHLNAFTFHYEDVKLIFYNPAVSYSQRLFALAHELGHIYLQHSYCDILGASADPARTAAQEQEANCFALYLLAPICVLKQCRVTGQKELSSLTLLEEPHLTQVSARLFHYKPCPEDQPVVNQYLKLIHSYRRRKHRLLRLSLFLFLGLSGVLLIFGLAVLPVLRSSANSVSPTAVVYVTPEGERYHLSSCYHLTGRSVSALSLSDAKAAGYTPCHSCLPNG